MGLLGKFFAPLPFVQLHEHSKKVHECVELLRRTGETNSNDQNTKFKTCLTG